MNFTNNGISLHRLLAERHNAMVASMAAKVIEDFRHSLWLLSCYPDPFEFTEWHYRDPGMAPRYRLRKGLS